VGGDESFDFKRRGGERSVLDEEQRGRGGRKVDVLSLRMASEKGDLRPIMRAEGRKEGRRGSASQFSRSRLVLFESVASSEYLSTS